LDPTILTTAQAAKILGVSVRTAQLWIESGALPSWKTPGGHRRVRLSDVLAKVGGGAEIATSGSLLAVVDTVRLTFYRSALVTRWGGALALFDDEQQAIFHAGWALPDVVLVEMDNDAPQRLSMLKSLMGQALLGHTRFYVVSSMDKARLARELGVGRSFTHVPAGAPSNDLSQQLLPAPVLQHDAHGGFPVAADEAFRLQGVHDSGLVDTPEEEIFERITSTAAEMLKMPIVLITLLTGDRQWFKSHHGLEMTETPRSWAFCNYTVLQQDIFQVQDLKADPRFGNNPAVAGEPWFRFYAGAPVRDARGRPLGSLCVIDIKPRKLSAQQSEALKTLAAQVSSEVVRRGQDRELRRQREATIQS